MNLNHTFPVTSTIMLKIEGASEQSIIDTEKALKTLKSEILGKPTHIADAILHSNLEAVSGDGHNFDYKVTHK